MNSRCMTPISSLESMPMKSVNQRTTNNFLKTNLNNQNHLIGKKVVFSKNGFIPIRNSEAF